MTAGILAGFFTAVLGWQINLICLHRGLQHGRRAAFWIGAGAIIGDVIWMSIAFAGAKTVLAYEQYWKYLKWLGVATICLAGLKILFHNSHAQPKDPLSAPNHGKNFLVGLLMVVSNPAFLIVWIGIVSFVLAYVPGASHPAYHFWFVLGFILGGTLWFLLLSCVLLVKVRQWKEERLHLISKISAVLLLAAAVFLIFKKI